MSSTIPEIEEFIALVRDGKPISALDPPCSQCNRSTYGPIGTRRKARFLKLAAFILDKLKVALDVFGRDNDSGKPWITVNEGGPAVSGEAALDIGWMRITFGWWGDRMQLPHDFCWSYRTAPNDWRGAYWGSWEELRNLETLAAKIKANRPITP